MLLPDVNVLINAAFSAAAQHQAASDWLAAAIEGDEMLLVPDIVLSGYVRISTSTYFDPPLSVDAAFDVCKRIRASDAFIALASTDMQWAIYRDLAVKHARRGGDFTDAYLAALAMANNATLVTFDRGFRRFEGLELFEPA